MSRRRLNSEIDKEDPDFVTRAAFPSEERPKFSRNVKNRPDVVQLDTMGDADKNGKSQTKSSADTADERLIADLTKRVEEYEFAAQGHKRDMQLKLDELKKNKKELSDLKQDLVTTKAQLEEALNQEPINSAANTLLDLDKDEISQLKRLNETQQNKLISREEEINNLSDKVRTQSELLLNYEFKLSEADDQLEALNKEIKKKSSTIPVAQESQSVDAPVQLMQQMMQAMQMMMETNQKLADTTQRMTENSVTRAALVHPGAANVANITGVLANDREFFTKWYPKLESFLRIQRVWIDPETAFVDLNEAQKNLAKQAYTIINLCVADLSLAEIKKYSNSTDAIIALRNLHDPTTPTSRMEAQLRANTTLYEEGGDINEHIAKLRQAFADLARHESPSTPKQQVDQLINSLPLSMSTLKSMYTAWPTIQYTFDNVAANLREIYARDELSKIQRGSSKLSDSAMTTASSNIRNRLGGFTTDKANRYSMAFSTNADSTSNSSNDNWILDSGATVHMSFQPSDFHDIVYGNFGNVTIANGTKLKIEGRGTVILVIDMNGSPLTLRLNKVSFVPQLSCKLISVRALETSGTPVSFSNGSAFLHLGSKHQKFAEFKSHSYLLILHTQRAAPCIHEWHKRIGHRNIRDIKQASTKLNLKITRCACISDCDACIRGKQADKSFPQVSEKPNNRLDIIVSDLSGPWPTSHGGKRYYMSLVDLATSYVEVHCLRQKSDATAVIKHYVVRQENLLKDLPKIFRSDRGTEYVNNELQTFFKEKGIKIQLTCPDSPQQNGVAERLNRTLSDAIRAQLLAHELPDCLWSEALHYTVYTFNRLPRKGLDQSPVEMFYQTTVEKQFIEFGHPCYVSTRKIKRTKLSERAVPMRFVGIDDASKGFRVWDGRKVWVERNVRLTSSHGPTLMEYQDRTSIPGDLQKSKPTIPPSDRILRSSERLKNKNALDSALRVIQSGTEPSTYKQAISCEDAHHWKEAINKELIACKKNKTWIKTSMPNDRKVIGCRWVFKIKRNGKGEIATYKARLVAQGFTQTAGIDYDETFAAVAKSQTFRMLLAKAGKEKLSIKQYDVASAFLNGNLKEDIYMKPPPGYEEGNFVLKLNKSLYGLKQAARVWYNTLSNALKSAGFTKSSNDPCLHIFRERNSTCYVISHVDDLLFVGSSLKLINSLASKLNQHFEVKDLGEVKDFLGMNITKDKNGIYSISQQAYIDKMAESFDLKSVKPQKIPINAGYYKLDHSILLPNNIEYRRLLGMLSYIAVNSRPDISASVNILAQKCVNPSTTDLTELKHILAYVFATKTEKLIMFNAEYKDVPLTAFTDANWAEDRNSRKSMSGILCMVYGAPIMWASRRQTQVALSSTEAEYYAVGDTIKELIWVQRVMHDLDIKLHLPTTVNCDNQSCVKLILNEKISRRSKHFDTKYHFIKDAVDSKLVQLSYVPTEHNIADIFTKPMTKQRITYMKSLLNMSS